ncbi:hypothetical protein B4135_4115 [Caldibacillus debilis]|uniref:Uncharacterized protein n=1 Tax=Caldibacillus debilis TaxID=301148 RepID=A0A150L7V1_9BACI|nr:hypothetical protein B4135_4115 [Caldibacillus debilis]
MQRKDGRKPSGEISFFRDGTHPFGRRQCSRRTWGGNAPQAGECFRKIRRNPKCASSGSSKARSFLLAALKPEQPPEACSGADRLSFRPFLAASVPMHWPQKNKQARDRP